MPGRITVAILNGKDIMRHDKSSGAPKVSKLDPYLKLQLGVGKSAPKKKSAPIKNAGKNPDFGQQELHFDVINPVDLIADGRISFRIGVWDDNTFSDDLLGEVVVSVMDVFADKEMQGWYKLSFKTTNAGVVPAGEIHLAFVFEPVMRGVLRFTAFEGKDLTSMEMFGKQDPYCLFELGEQSLRTATIDKGGRNPWFDEEVVDMWIDSSNWTDDLVFRCFDEDVASDDLIGQCRFSLIPYLSTFDAEEIWIQLVSSKGKAAGEVRLGVQFFPAGHLHVHVEKARKLADTDLIGKQDPYVVLTLDGEVRSFRRQTAVHEDGGTNPQWDEHFDFDIVDHLQLDLDVMDKDLASEDDLIGKCSVSLLEVFKRGWLEEWVPVQIRSKWGRLEERGQLKVTIDFEAPPGIKYPQLRDGMDAYDDSEREVRGALQAQRRTDKDAMAAIEAQRRGLKVSATLGVSDEFTDKEIEDAFRFIDLDKNMFIGAAEIRHVLICMGELITDEEIDEMVRMVDQDGDGQVSYDEFYKLAKDPDPSRPDFSTAVSRGRGGNQGGAPAAGFVGGLPPPPPPPGAGPKSGPSAAQRAADMKKKQQKKHLLQLFCNENSVNVPALMRAVKKYQNIDVDNEHVVTFQEFCDMFSVEPTGEIRKLFSLFVLPQAGDDKIDAREFFLSVNNFTGADKDHKVQLTFTLFDEDHSGTISTEELMEILKANHMVSDVQQVRKKAETIMAQGDTDGSGEIDLEEFVVVSKKFPNILFPAYT